MTRGVFELLDNGELRVVSRDLDVDWCGHVDGLPAIGLHAAADHSFAVVLLEPPTRAGPVQNLVKISRDASISWRAVLPPQTGTDCFVSFGLESAQYVLAATWSGFRVRLDVATGNIVEQVFTK